jgi:hypothetical protein
MDRADGLISPEMSRDKGRELHAAYASAQPFPYLPSTISFHQMG